MNPEEVRLNDFQRILFGEAYTTQTGAWSGYTQGGVKPILVLTGG
jgi:hypothetical protein